MLGTRSVILDQLRLVRPLLAAARGRGWPLAFLRAARRARALVRRSRWQGRRDAESHRARVLAILPALCGEGRHGPGVEADEPARRLAAAALERLDAAEAEAAGLFRIADPVERWHAFFDRTLVQGRHGLSEIECLSVEPALFHVRVARCLFRDVACEMGEPGLAETACEVHERFCSALLPSYSFELRRSRSDAVAGPASSACECLWTARATGPSPRPGPGSSRRARPSGSNAERTADDGVGMVC